MKTKLHYLLAIDALKININTYKKREKNSTSLLICHKTRILFSKSKIKKQTKTSQFLIRYEYAVRLTYFGNYISTKRHLDTNYRILM